MDLRAIASATTGTPPVNAGKTAPPAAAAVSAPAPTQSAAAVERAEAPPEEQEVNDALKSINNALQVKAQDLEFRVDEDSARTIVTVTDKNTKEVIRQMPTREAMEIAKALDRLQSLLAKQTA